MVNKTLILIVAAWSFLWSPMVRASVTGLCDSCHVMHFSQVGLAPTELTALGPQDYLLNNTCLGCHNGINTGAANAVPMVYTAGVMELAGGNFKYSDVTNQRNGHNPKELPGGADDTVTTPPGWTTGFNANGQVGTIDATNQLGCAGTLGCHGEHNDTGIFGAHHNHPTDAVHGKEATGATIGTSYRFLYQIKGYEDADYEAETANNHNVYYGVARGSDAPTDTQTMSYLCAECHGIFHSGASVTDGVAGAIFASPWIRHPVDISMSNTGEYSGYNYLTAAPVASATLTEAQHSTATTSVSGAGNRIVMCLSCHRAHASPYFASMRWDYRGAAGYLGCAKCHTSKD
ncbi:MAG: hypothetical protein KKD63_10675 [Proteobacteria bacterium]|nr:cytochrome c3 family protein [Desulfobulbaceae bacterium]MBU4153334.1 hypothetical protein [Pseudomonadota bacterium]